MRQTSPDVVVTVSLTDDPRIRTSGRVRETAPQADPTTQSFRVAVRERILDAIADDIVPQILERKRWVEIREPIPSADPLVSRVIGICVVVFRNIFDLGSRLSEFLWSLRLRTLAWPATAAAVVILAVITAVLVKEQGGSSDHEPGASTFAPGSASTTDEKIAALVAGGRQLMVAGDIPNARIVLQQAAEAGNAAAALEVGATYDPTILQQKAQIGGTTTASVPAMVDMADIRMARLWYEKAKDLGSTEAAVRLERLRSVPNPSR
jgi:hypothetical protein